MVTIGNLSALTVRNVARAINTEFIKYRYIAPIKYVNSAFAMPYPAVQSGGISAVAIATPAIAVPLSFLHTSTIAARPPSNAMNTSYIVGFVLASSSVGSSNVRGVTIKNNVDAIMLTTVIIHKFLNDLRKNSISLMPKAIPIPIIGPIMGEMSIAPIITGMEFTFRPTQAINTATNRIHTLAPLNCTFDTFNGEFSSLEYLEELNFSKPNLDLIKEQNIRERGAY